ncbi:DUF1801 domain-containing protein [Rubellimicrobium sp. CFH 75288]|uniref:DUF1801 domain-containing protein n=1 Tax=Rubellimicrobium sp. CFH 75288 TaxID=2697034 RepID=UPI0014129F51|nr:DUF1801 domain-containing protein [Rubellimicrobium sp. CFH 75288]NAZ35615.1 DUF1801 domain-containing protein [Rubellimicrobium sp. CFH 75288]
MKSGGQGRFEDIVALAPQHEALLRVIRSLVEAVHPEAVEMASPGEKAVYWGWGGAKMSEAYAYAIPHKAHVNLGFFRGTSLPDPEGLLEGTGKALRHVKLRQPGDLDRPGLRALLEAARDERRDALGAGRTGP